MNDGFLHRLPQRVTLCVAIPMCIAILMLSLPQSTLAQPGPTEGDAVIQQAGEAQAQSKAAVARLAELREQVIAIQQQHYLAKRAVLDAGKRLKDAEAKVKGQDEAVKKAEEGAKGPNEAVEQAKKVVDDMPEPTDDAKAKLADAIAKQKAPLEAVEKARAERQETQKSIDAAKQEIEQGNASVAKIEAELGAQSKLVDAATASLATAEAAYVETMQQVEQNWKKNGRWVSFAEEIAPLFQQRCLACHNARTAKGRLNMESYAMLMKGGESGLAIEPRKVDDSLLCTVIEDGSMPKDADPLSPEQISLVNKWVELGAILDAGVSPTAPLFRIIPRRPQPALPETYRVPIPVTAIALSPDGQTVVTSGYHEVLVWSMTEGTLQKRITNVAAQVYDIAFHHEGQRIAIAAGTPGQEGEVKVFHVGTGEMLSDLVVAEDAMFSVAFSPDGNSLAAAGADWAIRVFDLSTGRETVTIEDHADWVLGVSWSPDGNQLASASRDKTSKVFNAKTGDAVSTFNGHAEIVYDVTFLADSKQVATAGGDKQVRIWNAADGKEARKVAGFGGEVLSLVRGGDGRLYAGSSDKSGRVINPGDGKVLQTLSGHSDWVYTITAATPSQRAATGSYDGEVRIWNLENGQTVKNWKAIPTPPAE